VIKPAQKDQVRHAVHRRPDHKNIRHTAARLAPDRCGKSGQRSRIANRIALTGLVAFVMIGGGGAYLAAPQGFATSVPPFLPAIPVIIAARLVQIGIGIAALAFAVLCAAYLPLHVRDYIRPDPVFAPPVAATIRVVVQALFIWAGLSLWRRHIR
jgi:hypothetical protein